MSEAENFLTRWSRLKRESGLEGNGDEKRVDAVPDTAMPPAPAVDPASLPPIESIVADSDIRPFLAAGVPAQLTRDALRSAWTADPAIRDFIGIAESQWDFNDPTAIAGFGPLGAADYAQALVTRALASPNRAVDGTQECPRMAEKPASENADPQCGVPADKVQPVGAAPADSSHDADSDGQLAKITGVESLASQNAPAASAGSPPRHTHGGALPK